MKPMKKNDVDTKPKLNPGDYYITSYKEPIDSYEINFSNIAEALSSRLNGGSIKRYDRGHWTSRNDLLTAKRNHWYNLLESSKFKPEFDSTHGVRLFYKNSTISELPPEDVAPSYKDIEELASIHIMEAFKSSPLEQAEQRKTSILKACAQISRYLPEFEQRRPCYFIDRYSPKIGVTFQDEGTLTLLVGETSEIEFSYARKLESGTIRITGTAKLTKHLRNSKNIWKLLALQGITE